jgi:hypothetical protein
VTLDVETGEKIRVVGVNPPHHDVDSMTKVDTREKTHKKMKTSLRVEREREREGEKERERGIRERRIEEELKNTIEVEIEREREG